MIKGHRRSWKVMEGQGRSRKVKEGHGWSFPITRLTFCVRKLGVVVVVAVSAPVPVPFLWTLDLGFRTWIWDLDLGLDFGLTTIFNSPPQFRFGLEQSPLISPLL